MTRRKLDFFQHCETADNVLQAPKPLYRAVKGHWREDFFHNAHPLVVELACGKGEYTVGLASVFPEKNFVGVDVKGDRLARGSRRAMQQGLCNVGFLRTMIQQLDDFFAENEVSELWVTFPDPRPRTRDERRRLTHPRFLHLYARLLAPGGWFHFKTDNAALFAYTLDTLRAFGCHDLTATDDLYGSPLNADHHGIKTHFEALFYEKGHRIHYLRCRLNKPQNSVFQEETAAS